MTMKNVQSFYVVIMCNFRMKVNISCSLSLLPLWGLEGTLNKCVQNPCSLDFQHKWCNKLKAKTVDKKVPNDEGTVAVNLTGVDYYCRSLLKYSDNLTIDFVLL